MVGNFYFVHPIFTIYQEKHPKWCKEIIKDALEEMIPQRLISHSGPSTMLATLNLQREEKRYVVHALHYIPTKIAEEILTIEDVIPLYNIKFELFLPKTIKSVKSVPDGTTIPFNIENGALSFTLPELKGHGMIELAY